MNAPSYSMILNHLKHNIIFINQNEFQSFYFVELIDNKGVKFGFQWNLRVDVGVHHPTFGNTKE